jgi:hypothetical protein
VKQGKPFVNLIHPDRSYGVLRGAIGVPTASIEYPSARMEFGVSM